MRQLIQDRGSNQDRGEGPGQGRLHRPPDAAAQSLLYTTAAAMGVRNEDRGAFIVPQSRLCSLYYIRGEADDSSYIVGAHPCGRPGGVDGSFPLIHTLNVSDPTPRATIKAPHPTTQPPSPLRKLESGFGLRPMWALTISFVFILLFYLIPLPASARTVTNTGRIYGQLLDGSKRNATVARQSVTLQMTQGDNARDLTTITTDAQGAFSFTGLNTEKTINYALYTLYQGAQYYTDLIDLSTRPVQVVNLKVYDATTSIANLAVVQANMLVDTADAESKLMTISENYIFENLGLTTYVGSLQAKSGMPNALRFSLPKNARNVSLKSGFDGYQVIQVDAGFATNAAVPPGLSQFSFSLQVPYTAPSYDFAYTVVYPTVNLSLLVPVNIHARSAALSSQGPVNANQQTFQQFNARKLLPGAQIHVQLDGLPLTQQSASSQSQNQNTRWIILAILLMLAVVGVTWLLYRLSRRRSAKRRLQTARGNESSVEGGQGHLARPKATNREKGSQDAVMLSDEALASQKGQQEELLQELLELDKGYEAGTIKKSEYDARRASTKAELRTLMSKDSVEQPDPAKKTARSSGKGAK